MITRYFKIVATASLVASSVTVASAQQSCDCLINNVSGSITSVDGDVRVSGEDGFTPAAVGQQVGPGTTLLTGPTSSASVTFTAGCSLSVPSNGQLSTSPQAGGMCVRTSSIEPGGIQEPLPTPPGLGAGWLAVVGVVGGGAALVLSNDDNDEPVSR